MSEWGNNPETWQAIAAVVTAVGIIAVFISTILAWRSLRETRAQRRAIEREMAARMRPWVGLFGFNFEPAELASASNEDTFKLLLRNFGALPAQSAQLQLLVHPLTQEEGEPDNAIRRQEAGEKTLLPEEEGNYTVEISKYPQFRNWREARRDIYVEGTMNYALDESSFRTEFEAKIFFSQCKKEDDTKVKIRWRNRKAT